MTTAIRATREVTLNLHGEVYDILAIPRELVVDIDYTDFPEGDPARHVKRITALSEVDLNIACDLIEASESGHYRLTPVAAKRLLDSL